MRVVVTSSHSTLSLRCFTCTNPFTFYLTYSVIPFLHSSLIQLLYIFSLFYWYFLEEFMGSNSITTLEFWYMFVTIGIPLEWIYDYFVIHSNPWVFLKRSPQMSFIGQYSNLIFSFKMSSPMKFGIGSMCLVWFCNFDYHYLCWILFMSITIFLDIFLHVLHNTLSHILFVSNIIS